MSTSAESNASGREGGSVGKQKAWMLTFTYISNADKSPENIRAVVTVRRFVEGFLREKMTMAVVGRNRRATRTLASLRLLSHGESVCFVVRGRRQFAHWRPGAYPWALAAGPVDSAAPNTRQDIFHLRKPKAILQG